MTNESWGEVRQQLRRSIGDNNYAAWIEPLEFSDLTDGVLTFRVPSTFLGDWVTRYFSDPIINEVSAAGEPVKRISYVVQRPANGHATATDTARKPFAPAPPAAPAIPAHRGAPEIPGAPLDERFTFDRFVVGKPNELAHAAARRVAEGGDVTFNPLFLYGGVGLGKTHLMHAIAWEMQKRDPAARVLYLSAEQFMYRFVQALREKQMMDFKQLFRSVDVLMVDDVQFIAGKDSTQEEFFHTFNALVDQHRQVIISAESAPGAIEGLERRIVGRLQSGLVVDVHPTTYELRLGILQQRVEATRDKFAGVTLADGVLEFLAHRIDDNVRVVEGALMRLLAHGSLIGKAVTLDFAQESLRDLLAASDRRASIDEIQRIVADHYNIRLGDLLGPKRLRIYARPRQVAFFLCKELTERSLPEIGRHFGGRDHTTILHGIKRITELSRTDRQIAEDLNMLRRTLRNR